MRCKIARPVLSLLALSLALSANAKSKEEQYSSFNYSHLGMQNLTYKETLKNFAYQGDLASEFDVSNIILTAASYTHLYDDVGFLLSTQSNFINDITSDNWTVGGYGTVQTNDAKLTPSDLQTNAIWHFDNGSYLLFGGQLKLLNFTRSNLEIGEGADALNEAIRVSDEYFSQSFKTQISNFTGAIQEALTFFNALVGIGHNSLFDLRSNRVFYWHASATISTPMYYIAQNTNLQEQFDVEEITGAFSGYEFQANAGVGFEMLEGIALSFAVNYNVAAYDEINKDVQRDGETLTAAIPNIDMSGFQLSFGITWIN